MSENPGYYAIIPAHVRYADITPNAKLLYGEISALCNKEGFCWASNEYFSKLYRASERSVSRWIEELVSIKAVRLIMIGRNQRKVYLESDRQKLPSLIDKNVLSDRQKLLHNNTSNTTVTGASSATRIEVVSSSEESERRPASKPKYPNAHIVFQWFPYPEPSWKIDTTQLKHAELLYLRGEPKVRSILKFVDKHKDNDFFPKITKPSDLERKWEDIKAFKV